MNVSAQTQAIIASQTTPAISSASTPSKTQASHVSHMTSVTQPPISHSIGSTYIHQNINPSSANTICTTQPNMG